MSEHVESHDHDTCNQLLSLLGDYVDGCLNAELCAEIERHMQNCNRCTIVVNTLKKTVDLYQECTDEPCLPEDVRQRLFARLNLDDYLK